MENFNTLFSLNPWLIVKGVLLVFVFGYCFFALIVVRQVQLMTAVLKTTLSPWLKILAVAHLVLAVGVFLWVLILL